MSHFKDRVGERSVSFVKVIADLTHGSLQQLQGL